jgi:hypothetical protein
MVSIVLGYALITVCCWWSSDHAYIRSDHVIVFVDHAYIRSDHVILFVSATYVQYLDNSMAR